jgi:hypothetical protein
MSAINPSSFGVPPLHVLCVIANPSDLPRFDENGIWREMAAALQPLIAGGSLILERLSDPTEIALKASLARNIWHVLHLVVHGEERAANYGTIALKSSDGRARNLTASYLASLVGACTSLRVVVLQAADEASRGFQSVAEALAGQVAAVAIIPPLSGSAARIFAPKLYTGLRAGLSAGAIVKEVLVALTREGLGADAVRMVSDDEGKAIFPLEKTRAAAIAAPVSTPPQPPALTQPPTQLWHEEIQRKRAAGQFDVFLCHHSADKPAVKRIAQSLKEAGILPWLDVWELPPGQPWQPLLERQIGNIKSAAVFIGSTGFGPWQEQEINAFLRAFVKRKIPVIPVMLADAPSQPDLPPFLEGMVWVDFRNNDPDPLTMLIWGVTGNRPED